jgi:ABC-type multidrug transport system fused ATPase/permease subunit
LCDTWRGPDMEDTGQFADDAVTDTPPDEDKVSDDFGAAINFESQRDLEMVDRLIQGDHFGTSDKFKIPFSSQLKLSIRDTFQVDADVHNAADRALFRVNVSYTIMRLVTFVLYGCMMVAVSSAVFVYDSSRESHLVFLPLADFFAEKMGETVGLVTIFGFVLLIMATFTVLRVIVRSFAKREIMVNGERFSFAVTSRYEDILSKIVECCGKAGLLQKDNWSLRAKYWVKIALWCSKRAEYLDRYSTTMGWKATFILSSSEILFGIFKVLILLYVCVVVITGWDILNGLAGFNLNFALAGVGLAFLIAIAAVSGWYYLHHFPANIWTKVFAQKIVEDEGNKTHYFDQISELVESFVSTIEAGHRNGNRNVN